MKVDPHIDGDLARGVKDRPTELLAPPVTAWRHAARAEEQAKPRSLAPRPVPSDAGPNRNAVLVVSASADDINRLPDAVSIEKTASDAVDALHRAGWP